MSNYYNGKFSIIFFSQYNVKITRFSKIALLNITCFFYGTNRSIRLSGCFFFRVISRSTMTTATENEVWIIPFVRTTVGYPLDIYGELDLPETRHGAYRCVSRSSEIAGAPRVLPGEILASLSRNSRLEVSFASIARVKALLVNCSRWGASPLIALSWNCRVWISKVSRG